MALKIGRSRRGGRVGGGEEIQQPKKPVPVLSTKENYPNYKLTIISQKIRCNNLW